MREARVTTPEEHAERFCEKMRKALGAALLQVKADLLRGVRAAKTPSALYEALKVLAARNGDVITWEMTSNDRQIYPMEAVAGFIYGEMVTNITSAEAKQIAHLNSQSGKVELTETGLIKSSIQKVRAYAWWALQVAEKMPWDHKPVIAANYGLYAHDAQTTKLYRWDIWSNIHYGYVGTSIFFSASELIAGAEIANIMANWGKPLLVYGKAEDPYDQAAILLGIELWLKHGAGLQIDDFLSEIRNASSKIAAFECQYSARSE